MRGGEEGVDRLTTRAVGFLRSFRAVLVLYFAAKLSISVFFVWNFRRYFGGIPIKGLALLNLIPYLLFEAPGLYILYRGKYHRPQLLMRMTQRRERFIRYGARVFLLLWVLGLLGVAMSNLHATYDNVQAVLISVLILFFFPLWIPAFALAWMTHRSRKMETEKPGNFRVPLGREEQE